jgi:diaminohydroxyphosphoribosylaminopyrimidine deaminase/5-amino-6-(5-phosphoribosylamino)uracil reductase
MNEVLVEAGATLAGELLRQSLADELLLYVAPTLLGPGARALVALPELQELKDAVSFTLIETHPIGADLRLRFVPRAA